MRLRQFLLIVAPLALSACSTAKHELSGNPFDEIAPKAKPRYTQRSLPPTDTPSQNPTAVPTERYMEPPRSRQLGTPSPEVFIIPQPDPISALTSTNSSASLSKSTPVTDEMVAEAERLGQMGDMSGKAAVLEEAGYNGSAEAFYRLAQMYQDGSLPKSDALMFRFLSLSQDMGHVEAERVLGHLYLLGLGAPYDQAYGRRLLERATQRSIRAAREYGEMLANLRKPHLNDPERAIGYLQSAYDQGDLAAALPLAQTLEFVGRSADALVLRAYAEQLATEEPRRESGHQLSMKERALNGDANAIFDYAQQVLIRKIPDPDPELTAYCWLTVAKELGHEMAARELRYIEGVRLSSERRQPGLLDQCIDDLHYQVTGQELIAPGSLEDPVPSP